MGAVTGALQIKFRAAADDLLAVLDKGGQHSLQAQHARLVIDQRQHLQAKGLLQGCIFKEILECRLGVGIAVEFDHNPHPGAITLIAQIGEPLQLAIAGQRRNSLDQCRLVGLIGQLGDHNAHPPAAHLFKVGLGL